MLMFILFVSFFLFPEGALCTKWLSCKCTGESGVGKTTFVNTLFTSTIKEPKILSKRRLRPPNKTVQIQITKAGKIMIE